MHLQRIVRKDLLEARKRRVDLNWARRTPWADHRLELPQCTHRHEGEWALAIRPPGVRLYQRPKGRRAHDSRGLRGVQEIAELIVARIEEVLVVISVQKQHHVGLKLQDSLIEVDQVVMGPGARDGRVDDLDFDAWQRILK